MPTTILVVDDEPDLETLILQRFRKRIRAQDFIFVFASNGLEALEALAAAGEIEIVLTDINMPVMDGLTLLAKIAELDMLLKSVVVSAYGDMENIRTAMNRGAFDFITKPIDFRDLEITIDKTVQELKQLKDGLLNKQRLIAMQQELEVAARIQHAILPKTFPPFPHRSDFEIFATMQAARQVGGDFYDFFFVDEHRLGFVIADVAGKGVPAALYMAVSRSLLKATALTGQEAGPCLKHVNDLLCADGTQGLFVTLFYGILDTRNGEVAYSNAGHNPPYVLRKDGAAEALPNQGGLVLGIQETANYETAAITLAPGESLCLYTDGVTEAMNAQREFFDRTRLRQRLEASYAAPLETLIRELVSDIAAFAGNAPQHDDITALAIRYHGNGAC